VNLKVAISKTCCALKALRRSKSPFPTPLPQARREVVCWHGHVCYRFSSAPDSRWCSPRGGCTLQRGAHCYGAKQIARPSSQFHPIAFSTSVLSLLPPSLPCLYSQQQHSAKMNTSERTSRSHNASQGSKHTIDCQNGSLS
jgi:hypothetical protein